MNWFWIALIAPFFWSISNHIDKFLLDKHLKGIGKEALILYSTLFGLVMLPLAYFFDHSVFSFKLVQIIILIIAGCLNSLTIYLYLFALENEETSVVVPFFQTIPIFGFILGFFILGETLSVNQIAGALIIILGAFILSLEINELKRMGIKKKIALLMLGSSFSFAVYEILFKLVAIDSSFWISIFWQYFGLFIFGIVLFSSSRKYREDFVFLIKKHDWKFFTINVTNESLTIIGNTFNNFALLLAPIALIMTINSYQPVLVFIEGLFLTSFFPKIASEKSSYKHIIHKSISILIVFIGTLLLYN